MSSDQWNKIPITGNAEDVFRALLNTDIDLAQRETDLYVFQARKVDNGYIITIAKKVQDEPERTVPLVPEHGQ